MTLNLKNLFSCESYVINCYKLLGHVDLRVLRLRELAIAFVRQNVAKEFYEKLIMRPREIEKKYGL
jgi:hypothetical protein